MSFRVKPNRLKSLITRGFFPKEIPCCFRPTNFSDIVDLSPDELNQNKRQSAKLISHNVTRFGSFTRKLGIPNPITFYRLSSLISEHFNEILPLTIKSSYGVTFPKSSTTGRAFVWESDWQEWKEEKIKRQAGYKYALKTDISNFYPSIYTHIIPWVLHGKKHSKSNKRDKTLLGNRIDSSIGFSQDNQTQGLPIGPDTSFLISELILNKIDTTIKKQLKSAKIKHSAIRFVDDCEFYFLNNDDANKALNIISRVYSNFELALSPHKTEIYKLPLEFEKKWVSQIRSYPSPIATKKSQKSKRQLIIDYFDFIIELQRENPHEQVISYAMARIEKEFYLLDDELLFFSLLINLIPLDTSILKWIIHFLNLDSKLLESNMLQNLFQEVIPRIALDCSEHGKHNDTLWALIISYIFDISFSKKMSNEIYKLGNSFVKILCLDLTLVSLMKIEKSLSPKEDDFFEEDWLLFYTVFTNDEFINFRSNKSNGIKKNIFFKMLKNNNVSFYEPFPSDDSIEAIQEYVAKLCDKIESTEYKIEIDGDFYDPEDPHLSQCLRCGAFFTPSEQEQICNSCWDDITHEDDIPF